MLVLASASPRRRELLALLGLPFRVEPSRYEEPPPPTSPVSLPGLVTSLASAKALEVAGRLADENITVIGADTLVTLADSDNGVPLGKPKDGRDAARMLEMLAGRTHYVYTGIALARYSIGAASVSAVTSARTGVTFRPLSSEIIQDYIRTGEPMDKAGAYGAQGYAAPFISGFDGDFYNVVGLPLFTLGALLESIGEIWWHNRSSMPPIIG
jgi:septum formation protein